MRFFAWVSGKTVSVPDIQCLIRWIIVFLAGSSLEKTIKRAQGLDTVHKILSGLVVNAGYSLLLGPLDIAFTVIYKQGPICRGSNQFQHIAKHRGITFAFGQMVAVEYLIEMMKKFMASFQDIQPGDLIAQNGAFTALCT